MPYIQTHKPKAICLFESYLVGNPEDRFSRDESQNIAIITLNRRKDAGRMTKRNSWISIQILRVIMVIHAREAKRNFLRDNNAWIFLPFEPQEKTCLWGFQPGKTQTVLRSHRE